MTATSKELLEHLRAKIDRIDRAMHRLVVTRSEIALQIGRTKNSTLPLRPGREAFILRKLVALTPAGTPVEPLVRIWRELMGISVQLQGALRLAVWAPAATYEVCALARSHFGQEVSLVVHQRFGDLLAMMESCPSTVGIVPTTGTVMKSPWWLQLCQVKNAPRIIARLPFVQPKNLLSEQDAFVIAPVVADPSGQDRTLMVVSLPADNDQAQQTYFARLQREHGQLVQRVDDSMLVDIPGYIETNEAKRIFACGSPSSLKVIGHFAVPMSSSPNHT